MEDTRPDARVPAPEAPDDASDETVSNAELETLGVQLSAAEKTIAELKDALLRERADIENQRRRLQRDLDQSRKFANESLLRQLLQVADNLEHGLAADTDNAQALRDGMQLTLKSLQKVMADHGITEVDPVGQAFNPEQHQAMSMVATDAQPPDTVVSVMQKGYLLNDRLLRSALVVVAKASTP